MKNFFRSKLSAHFGIIVMMTVIVIFLTGCMSMLMSMAQSQYKDYGYFDSAVPADQLSELRFGMVNVKSFNGKSVSWGDRANNMGFAKVPSGVNTIVFDWVHETQNMPRVNYDSVRGAATYTYTTTTSSLRNISFNDVEMLAGHKYFIGGGMGTDGQLRIWLLDMTYTPSGFYGDTVANAPRANSTPTKFEGTWVNIYGESFIISGNSWLQTLPPLTGSNTGPNQVQMRGTFEFNDEYLTLYSTGTSVDGGIWINISSMKQAYIYRYSFENENLMLELPFMLPTMAYIKE